MPKRNQFNTKVDYFLGVDRDWRECKDRQLRVEIDKFMEQELTSKNRSLTLLGTMQYLSEGMDRYKLGRDIDFFLQIILVGSILFRRSHHAIGNFPP
jgi:hypothetical protein